MWRAFDEEAERSDRYTRTAYFAEEFRSQSGSSTKKKKRNAFQMCGQSEFVQYDGVHGLYVNGTVSDEEENLTDSP
uniref:Uncharacterized protein n=1 Tax=Caenorhabditis japonica TaxID=281687 RepID=A0A8R1DWB2_CAEJA